MLVAEFVDSFHELRSRVGCGETSTHNCREAAELLMRRHSMQVNGNDAHRETLRQTFLDRDFRQRGCFARARRADQDHRAVRIGTVWREPGPESQLLTDAFGG